MKSRLNISLLLSVILAITACGPDDRNADSDTPAPSAKDPGPLPEPIPAPTTTSTADPAEVFRRAFWRQPTSADQILHAERRVEPDDNSWQWFLQIHPSPELLAALRDPDNLGLRALPPGETPRPWPTTSEPQPVWFPIHAVLTEADFEILQSHATELTILYRPSENLLFATDHGAGFAPPVQ